MVVYFSGMIYKHYSRLGDFPIKQNEEVKDIHNEIFNNILHFIKNCLHVDCLLDGFVMYNNKVIIIEIEIITPIPDSMIPMDFCQKYLPINNFTTDDIRSKFEFFQRIK